MPSIRKRNFVLDTEFYEGPKQRHLFGFPVGRITPTIDLISLGCVCVEDKRELYLLNSEHDVNYSWHVQDKDGTYWLRDNVLLPIYKENVQGDAQLALPFTKTTMEWIFKTKGQHPAEIGYQLLIFTQPEAYEDWTGPMDSFYESEFEDEPVFWTHYGDYDWVVTMQLYGRMMNKPKSFPFLAMDLQQYQIQVGLSTEARNKLVPANDHPHHALYDARWEVALLKVIMQREAEIAQHTRSAFERGKRLQYSELSELLRDAIYGCKFTTIPQITAGFHQFRQYPTGSLNMWLFVGQDKRQFAATNLEMTYTAEQGMKAEFVNDTEGFLQTKLLRKFISAAVTRGLAAWSAEEPKFSDKPMPLAFNSDPKKAADAFRDHGGPGQSRYIRIA
jgi:hypothetical protein